MWSNWLSLSLLVALLPTEAARVKLDDAITRRLLHSGKPRIGLWQALHEQKVNELAQATISDHDAQATFEVASKPKYEAYCFEQPLTHFSSSANTTFCQRYWMDASAYREGGPVFVLDGGETDGAGRLPYLEKGILQILANETGGLSIVLEHRYYGESINVPDLSTDNLRFLNNEEAMEDSANFIENFKPPSSLLSLSDDLLHPNNTPWIYYGGSYAGARSAHMRVQYPHLVWGAIASSAVTHAQIEFPEYNDPIRKYGPPDCIEALQDVVQTVDTILDLPGPASTVLKGLFGLEQLSDNSDFASVMDDPLGGWQGRNWDPKVGTNEFDEFCEALTAPGPGSTIGAVKVGQEVLNMAKYIRENYVSQCPRSEGKPASDIEKCFGTQNETYYLNTDLDQIWRLWEFQVCTQWGYFQMAHPEGENIISKRIDLEYTSKRCRLAFPPGKHFTVPEWPDVESVNARGDYAIEMDRLAFIDGDRDPWRPATPGADIAPKRTSTVNKPVHVIFDGVHHYDENGLTDHMLEPSRIQDVHELEKNFVSEWVAQFHEEKAKRAVV